MQQIDRSESFPANTRIGRQAYRSPQLSILGDVCSLTETGSMNSVEGQRFLFFCTGNNMTGTTSMC